MSDSTEYQTTTGVSNLSDSSGSNGSHRTEVRHLQLTLPAHTCLAYKILPHDFTEDSLLHGQSAADWSAIYAQFTIPHAVSYLGNHFDRGVEDAVLVVIKTLIPLSCIIYDDARFNISSTSSLLKAKLMYDYLQTHVASELRIMTESQQGIPLLQAIGQQLQSFVVIYDAEHQMECAIPHNLMTNQHFTYDIIARFRRDEKCVWRVKSCWHCLGVPVLDEEEDLQMDADGDHEAHGDQDADQDGAHCDAPKEGSVIRQQVAIPLSKDEKDDAALLGVKLESLLLPLLSPEEQKVNWMSAVWTR